MPRVIAKYAGGQRGASTFSFNWHRAESRGPARRGQAARETAAILAFSYRRRWVHPSRGCPWG